MAMTSLQLRALLAEKFPGLKTRLNEPESASPNLWPLDWAGGDTAWPNSLARGALTEVVAGSNSGSARLLHALLQWAAGENQIVALIDGGDCLEVTALDEKVLSRLLWVRCRSTAEAVKAVDLVLRDANFSLVLLDLKLNQAAQLRKIPATVWHRLQRLIEKTATVCVIFTPHALVSAPRQRLVLPAKDGAFPRL